MPAVGMEKHFGPVSKSAIWGDFKEREAEMTAPAINRILLAV